MNDKTGGHRGLRRAGALAVVAAAAVLAAACGGGSAPSSAGSASAESATFAQQLALAQCMRSHGQPSFPDPSASGGFSLNVTTLDSSQTQAAYGACRHLLPGGGPSLAQLEQQAQLRLAQQLPALLKFSRCMRGHGVPNFPDPPANGQGSTAPLEGTGVDPQAPQFQAAVRACQHLAPGLHISARASTHAS
jgi:hypothetical protein